VGMSSKASKASALLPIDGSLRISWRVMAAPACVL
jgi:hypothetical protein